MTLNVMYDGSNLYPKFHPADPSQTSDLKHGLSYRSRTVRPPTYYVVDFGISRQYNIEDDAPRAYPILGGDKSVPEHQGDRALEKCDPFPTDIYYLGNFIREEILQVTSPRPPGYSQAHGVNTEIYRIRVHAASHCRHGAGRPF